MKRKLSLSVISPVYRAEKIVDKLVSEIVETINPITEDYEIILVDDGSPDNSWERIYQNCRINKKVKGIKLSRNFGQHNAITAGLNAANGEWIVVMDCDLQDQPQEIIKLIEKAKEGYDLVFAQRKSRQDKLIKRMTSWVFYKIFGYLTDTAQDSSVANFGIYHKKVIQAVLSMGDYVRYFPTMVQWVGFKKAYIDVAHSERSQGTSTYTWSKLFKLAFNNIISFSDKPLRLMIWFGITLVLFSFLIGVAYLVKYFLGHIVVLGYTSLIISIWFLSGTIILTLGMVGIYVGKTFEVAKKRPLFIVERTINSNEHNN